MTNEYMKDVKNRFKKARKRLDNTVDDYIVKEFKATPHNAVKIRCQK